MTILFLFTTTALCFVAWIYSYLGMQIYKQLLAAADEDLARVERELDEIKTEIEENVLDGLDFDLVQAIVDIRHWKEVAKNADEL